MKLPIFLFISFCIFCQLTANDDINAEKSSDAGGCNKKSLGYMAKGEKNNRVPDVCAEATCLGDDQISLRGCPLFKLPGNCVVTPGDLSKPYPDCCPGHKCL